MPQNQYSFVTALKYLKINKPLGANWNITGELKISNSRSVAERLVTNALRQSAGALEADQILNGKPFVFSIAEYPVEDSSYEKQLSVLYAHLARAQVFINILWLIKDNSVNFELGFLQYPYRRSPARISSNFVSSLFNNATGTRSEVVFDETELATAISMFINLYGEESNETVLSLPTLAPTGDIDRVSRAFYFLQGARLMGFLPEKIAYYCTCFETLVSTSATELAHQVSERVAILIAKNPSESVEIYRNIKRAYDTRSKLVHGDRLTAEETRYATDSQNCDNYLRRLFHTLINNPDIRSAIDQNPEKVNQFFLGRLFGTDCTEGES